MMYIEIVKYEGRMLILGQSDIFCDHNVAHFFKNDFFQLRA